MTLRSGFCRKRSSHRGAALLIVLATLIITMTAMTMLVRAASTLQIQSQFEGSRATADDLLAAAEAPIQRWLKEESAKAVTPADAISPRVELLNEELTFNGRECTLRITAFDQCGMVSMETALGGSPLRLAVPAELLRVIDKVKHPKSDPKDIAGLDWFAHPDEERTSYRIFPADHATDVPALGESIATHASAGGAGGGGGAGVTAGAGVQRINISTAPMPLVEAAMRLAGRGGYEQVLAARKSGKPANIGSTIEPPSVRSSGQASGTVGSDNRFAPQIVTTSTCWSFRIDVHVGPLWRSWWAIYQPGQSASGGGGGGGGGKWECVQRLAITN